MYYLNLYIKNSSANDEMAQWVEALVTKPDHLSLIPGTPTAGENRLLSRPLMATSMPHPHTNKELTVKKKLFLWGIHCSVLYA